MLKIGQTVAYVATKNDAVFIQKSIEQNSWGNRIEEGSYIAAIITKVWSETCVNVKIIHDGLMSDQWKTSCGIGDTPGCVIP